ncbi:MAG: hypothetical protein FJ265_14865 [Planctomycetes bacterium]|nr:hypothetical protein [Planctomycetota bacterium]
MSAPLHVAIPDGTGPYWRGLLGRAGLPVRELGTADHAAATLFLPDAAGLASRALRQIVARWRGAGVPALAGPAWGKVFGVHLARGAGIGLCRGEAALVRRLDPAPLLVLPLPDAERLLRAPACLQELAGPRGANAREVISTADHGGLRRCVTAALRGLAFAAGRPFVHLAHLPPGRHGALAVRIDADGYRQEATDGVLAALHGAGLRATWFVDVERHLLRGGLPHVRAIAAAGHEVQSHFFRHYTYRSAARNERNLRRSLDELARIGIVATAAAAPFGTWHPGLDRALRACGLRWSSEFSRAHDDVPGGLAGTADEPWQVPVHPVCPALLLAGGAGPAAVREWFGAELRQCLARGEPAAFYGHPIDDLGRVPDLLPALAAAARDLAPSLWTPTLGELHPFCRRRAAQPLHVEFDGDVARGEVDGAAPLVVERAGAPPATVYGNFALRAVRPALAEDHGPVLVPAPYRPRARGRDRLATRKLQLRRLLHELRR